MGIGRVRSPSPARLTPETESLRAGWRPAAHVGVEGEKFVTGEFTTDELAELRDGKGLLIGLSFTPVKVADVGVVIFDARGWVKDGRRSW
jgi:hypothetical protein